MVGWLAGGIILAACSKGTQAGGTATVPTAAPTTGDPWAVPATITPDYLNKVLAKLNQIDGDAFRDARATNAVSAVFLTDERAIRANDSEVQLEAKDLQANIDKRFNGIKPTPGDRRMDVTAIVTAPSPCVMARVNIDLTALTTGPPLQYPQWYVALVPHDASTLNPTHWVFADDGFEPGGGAPDPHHACA